MISNVGGGAVLVAAAQDMSYVNVPTAVRVSMLAAVSFAIGQDISPGIVDRKTTEGRLSRAAGAPTYNKPTRRQHCYGSSH